MTCEQKLKSITKTLKQDLEKYDNECKCSPSPTWLQVGLWQHTKYVLSLLEE